MSLQSLEGSDFEMPVRPSIDDRRGEVFGDPVVATALPDAKVAWAPPPHAFAEIRCRSTDAAGAVSPHR
ncbi:MAG: hypothetical protein EA356_03195 [Geminicoccaceae bacterium]|nr:MAG: hypothetical protein EA356_03195 [Geminicoccaceae bacterium]